MTMEIMRLIVGRTLPSAPITLSELSTMLAFANHCSTQRNSSAMVAALA